jgi:Zn finger protein HypA/HybF involved in hydrogenase expression
MPNKLTIDEFIERSKLKHGDKYDYSKSFYINSKTKLLITCPKHGDFLQTPSDHYLSGCGCPKCDPTRSIGTSEFINRSKKIHGNKYDYSKVEYIRNNIKVDIICKKHGSFLQEPGAHLNKNGCPNCYTNNKKITTKEFIEKSKKVHGDRYDYSLVEYTKKRNKVKITCKKHGVFEQKAYVHYQGHGCPICNSSKLELYMRDKLIKLNIEFEQNKKYNTCRNILPLPFDFYLKKYNYLIECDGVQHLKPIEYFGGEERFEYQKNNDSIKDKWCKNNNIVLYRLNNFKDIDSLLESLIS